jgi:hypothetical protein
VVSFARLLKNLKALGKRDVYSYHPIASRVDKGESICHIEQRRHLHHCRTMIGIAKGNRDMLMAHRDIEVAV